METFINVSLINLSADETFSQLVSLKDVLWIKYCNYTFDMDPSLDMDADKFNCLACKKQNL